MGLNPLPPKSATWHSRYCTEIQRVPYGTVVVAKI